MYNFLFYVVPALLTLRYINHLRVKNMTLKIENNLLSLYNELKLRAIKGVVSNKDKEYIFLEQGILKSYKQIHILNIWMIIYYAIREGNNLRNRDSSNFNQTSPLHDIHIKMTAISVYYLIGKSFFSFTLLFILKLLFKVNLSYDNNCTEKIAENMQPNIVNNKLEKFSEKMEKYTLEAERRIATISEKQLAWA